MLCSVVLVFAAPTSGQAQPPEQPIPTQREQAGGLWKLDLEAGYRVQGVSSYRGVYLAPGVWFELQSGIELGLFAPLHFRTSAEGRAGIEYSFGLEPRVRFVLSENLRADVAFGLAAEGQEHVQGVSSYGAGLQVGDVMSMRVTHERYRLGPNFESTGMPGHTNANFVDIAYTGRTGQSVAYGEILVLLVLAGVTAGAR